MSDDEITSSHSETESFRRCKRAHFYSRGLRIEPTSVSYALLRGNVGHNALAYYYEDLMNGKDHDTAANRAMTTGLSDVLLKHDPLVIAKVLPVLERLLEQYFDAFAHESKEIQVLGVEQSFNVEVADDYKINFVIDLIVSVPGSGVEVWDHKIVYNFYNPTALDVSPQLPMYVAGSKMLGFPVSKAVYNELRWQETKENKENPRLRFRRQEVPISQNRVMRTLEEQVIVGEEIAELRKLPLEEWDRLATGVRSGQICDRCGYGRICAGDLNGDDRRLYIGVDYRKKPERV